MSNFKSLFCFVLMVSLGEKRSHYAEALAVSPTIVVTPS